jgi:small subunit ribosomal protein S6
MIEMREYEVAVILKPGLEENDRAQIVERVSGWLTQGEEESGKPAADHWGQRSLAYPIKKFTEGYYKFYKETLLHTKNVEFKPNVFFYEDI